MYPASDAFINEVQKDSRTFKARITAGDDVFTSEIVSIVFNEGSCGGDAFTIGSVFISYVDIIMSAIDEQLVDREMLVELGVVIGGDEDNPEYIPMGYFTAGLSDISKTQDSLTIKAMDRLSSKCGETYTPKVSFPCKVQAVIDDIATQAGVEIATDINTSGTIEEEMTGLSYSTALGYIAGILGGFVYADRHGVIQIALYPAEAVLEVPADRQKTELSIAETAYKVDGLTVIVSEGSESGGDDSGGDDDDGGDEPDEGIKYHYGDGVGITVQNPYMTEALFDAMKGRVVGYEFRSGTAEFLGDPRLDPIDAITAYDYKGDAYLIPCMLLTHTFDGGLTTTITAPAMAQSDTVTGPVTQAVTQLSTEMLLANQVITKRLTADEATIGALTVTVAYIDETYIDKATVGALITEELYATIAEFGFITTDTLKATLAEFGYVTADEIDALIGSFGYITADEVDALVGSFGYLTADSLVITNLNAFTANITALLAGQEGVGELQAIHLTADNVVIDDAVIDSILASNATIATLLAGNIYTDYIKISNNESETLLIDGSTIQMSDGTTVRVQMGLDASGNYNFYIFSEDGSVIWDALGLTEAGLIGNGAIIKDVAVADDANISGYKLNIGEIAERLEDGVLILDAAQVTIDGNTLDYKLTQMTEQIEGISFEGLVKFDTYFCLWPSATEPPVDEEDFVPALTDEALTDCSYTDLYDYSDLWSMTEPAQEEGMYKWVRYLLYYEDGHTEWSTPYCITDNVVRERTTVMQTQLEVVQGEISAKVWLTDISEAIDTTVSDLWAQIDITLSSIVSQVGDMSTSVGELEARVSTQEITVDGIVTEVYNLQAQIETLDLTGVKNITTYFCKWYSATEKPPTDEEDFVPALTDVALTDVSYTDLYDYSDFWTEDRPDDSDGSYIWVRYLLEYQDGSTGWSDPYCLSDEYTRTQIQGAYSKIEQLANSINLEVTGVLGGTAQIKLTVDQAEIKQDLDLSQVREAFADDDSEVMISAGLVNFAANTIIINSDNLTVDQEGDIWASNAYIDGTIVTETEEYRARLSSGALRFASYNSNTAAWEEEGSFGASYFRNYPDERGVALYARQDAEYIGFGWDDDGDLGYDWQYIINLGVPSSIMGYSERHIFYGDVRMRNSLYVNSRIYADDNIYPYNVWFSNTRGIISDKANGSDYAWLMWLNEKNNLHVGSSDTDSFVNDLYLHAKNDVWLSPDNGYVYVEYPEDIDTGWPIPRHEFWTVSITPSAANTPTGEAVTWQQGFASRPWCYANPSTAVPGTTVTGCAVAGISTTGATVYLTRTNTTSTTIYLLAVGV